MSLPALHQALLVILAISALAFGLAVAMRLAWCSVQALRAARFALAAWPILGILCLAASFGAVVFVWFAYGVSHSEKTQWTDLQMSAVSFLPFYAVCYLLWRMGRAFPGRLANRTA